MTGEVGLAPDDVWTVVVAGGSGRRYGRAKQYDVISGRSVLDWSIDVASSVGRAVVVVPADDVDDASARLGGVAVVAGGATRTESVRAGVAAVPDAARVILVHDAARPAASPELFARVVAAVVDADGSRPAVGAVPVIAVTDSLRHPVDGAIDRSELRAVQTPQGFPGGPFRDALAAGGDASDDATLFEAAGGTIVCVDGEATNIKLTHAVDHATLTAVLTTEEVR